MTKTFQFLLILGLFCISNNLTNAQFLSEYGVNNYLPPSTDHADLVGKSISFWKNGKWESRDSTLFFYESNRIEHILSYGYFNGIWQEDSQCEYGYNSNGNQILDVYYHIGHNDGSKTVFSQYEYEGDSLPSKKTVHIWDGESWNQSGEYVITYEEGLPIVVISYQSAGGELVPYKKENFLWDNGRLQKKEINRWLDGHFVPYIERRFSYDNLGRIVHVTDDIIKSENTKIPFKSISYVYGDIDFPDTWTEKISGKWRDGILKNEYQDTHILDEYGRVITAMRRIYTVEGWAKKSLTRYYYQSVQTTATSDEDKVPGFTLRPNPSFGKVSIIYPKGGPEIEKVEFFDIEGRKVFEKRIDHRRDYSNMDLEKLEKGAYNIRVISEKSISTRRLILLK